MRLPITLFAAALAFAQPTLAQSSFTGLGLLFDGEYSEAAAVSADGTVVAGRAGTDTNGTQAVRWTRDTGLTALGVLEGGNELSEAYGISASGSTIVGASDSATGIRAVRWDGDSGPEEIDPGNGDSSLAYGVSGSGKFAVGYISGAEFEAARWLGGGATDLLGFVPGDDTSSAAMAASFDGSVVAGAGAPTPFRWTQDGGMVGLGLLPGADGIQPAAANAISYDGSVIAGYSDSDIGLQAFRWTEKGMVGLGQMGGLASAAFGMNDNGSIIVGFALSVEGPEAIIWDEAHGMRSIRQVLIDDGLGDALEGWTLETTTAISADGRTIVGNGTHEVAPGVFQGEGWVAYLGSADCYPDFTGDGVLDLFDFLDYVNAFNAKDPAADCIADGSFDLFDFLCFVNAFNTGC